MRILRHSVRSLFPAVLLLAAVACGGRARRVESPSFPFERPTVALQDVRLRGAGLRGGAAEVELRVFNPNDYDLTSPRVDYRVLLDDVEVATGLTDLDVTVPAGDSVVVKLPANFGYLAMGRAGRVLVNSGAAPYRVLGRITVGTPYGRTAFPYDRAGQFSTLSARLTR